MYFDENFIVYIFQAIYSIPKLVLSKNSNRCLKGWYYIYHINYEKEHLQLLVARLYIILKIRLKT